MTHHVDYARFPSSLMVVWVFDTDANRDQVLANGQNKRMLELTTLALSDANVHVSQVSANLHSILKSNVSGRMPVTGGSV